MAVAPTLPGLNIITNPNSFLINDSISKYLKETRTSQQARNNHPSQPSKLSGVVRLKSPVDFSRLQLSPRYKEPKKIRLEKIGTKKKICAFLNSDKRQHRDTAVQDLQRQFKEATGLEILFKPTFGKVTSEPSR